MRQKLTPAFVISVEPTTRHEIYWDTEQSGFGLLVLPSGKRRFLVQYRAQGRSRRMTFRPGLTLTEARKEAKIKLADVAKGGDPLAERRRQEGEAANTIKAITEEYFKREGNKLRTGERRKADLERLVFPVLGARQIGEIRRSDIVRLLDNIEDENGPHMAQAILTAMSRIMNWHASRDDDFVPPIRRGMARIKPQEHARARILTDDELRIVWRAAEIFHCRPYGSIIRFLLLTAVRRGEAAKMTWNELADGVWIIPGERMKQRREHVVPLSPQAKAIVDNITCVAGCSFVFSIDARHPLSGFSVFKRAFDEAILEALRKENPEAKSMPAWRHHDLQRTARSLMSRAGVDSNIAERCLAHVVGGVRGIYDRYAYFDEKKRALEVLATLIDRIVNPADNNVVLMRKEPKAG